MKRILTVILSIILILSGANASDYNAMPNGAVAFAWTADDEAGAYRADGGTNRLWLYVESTTDANNAVFNGAGFGLNPGYSYNAYFPYNSTYYTNNLPQTAFPVTYAGQTQTGNDNTSHLAAYDFMTSQTTMADVSTVIRFQHLGAIIRFAIQVPEDVTLSSLVLRSDATPFVADATMNITNNTLTPVTTSLKQRLNLKDVSVAANDSLIAYMMLAPGFYVGQQLYITLITADGRGVLASINGMDIQPGHAYPIEMTVTNFFYTPEEQGSDVTWDLSKPNIVTHEATAGIPVYSPKGYAPDFLPAERQVATSVRAPHALTPTPTATYDLSGRRIQTPRPNQIIISNGKKTIR